MKDKKLSLFAYEYIKFFFLGEGHGPILFAVREHIYKTTWAY